MEEDIIVVDEEVDIRDIVDGIMRDEGNEKRKDLDEDREIEEINERDKRMVFIDIWIKGRRIEGMEMMEEIKKKNNELKVVMI